MGLNIFRGDTVKGTFTLRTIDPVDSTKMNNYVIPAGATLQMNLPGTPTVTISTTDSEITIVNAQTGSCSFVISNTKTELLSLGDKLAVDVIVNETNGDTTTFEKMKIINIADRANP
jgi:hypothetical protein